MKNVWIWLVVAVVVIGGGYWYWQSQQSPAMSDDGTPMATDAMDDASAASATSSTSNSDTSTTGSGDTGISAGVSVGVTAGKTVTINYNGDAFNPSTVTIKKGDTVTFVSTAKDMWVASNPHPEHTAYDGTTRSVHCAAGYAGAAPFDQCSVGASFSFTFNKTGTWGFHNHMNPGLGGTVIVQ